MNPVLVGTELYLDPYPPYSFFNKEGDTVQVPDVTVLNFPEGFSVRMHSRDGSGAWGDPEVNKYKILFFNVGLTYRDPQGVPILMLIPKQEKSAKGRGRKRKQSDMECISLREVSATGPWEPGKRIPVVVAELP